MRWLAFGTYDIRRHPRVGVLIEGLRDSGDDVVEINEPLRLDTAGRVAMLRQPWRLPVLAAMLARCWLVLAVRVFRRRAEPAVDAILVGYLGHLDIWLARVLFPHTPIVLDHLVSAAGTARDRGLVADRTTRSRLLRAVDDAALRRADVILVDTAEHAAELPEHAARRAVVVPVGAPAAWFSTGPPKAESREPRDRLRAVFVGLYTPLHGTATLGEALAMLADDERIAVTMVGQGQDYRTCRQVAAANPRVRWIDWVPPGELPEFVAGHDVCLGIFGTTEKARTVVPTKVFHGAAAGCALVTSDTPPQRRVLGGAALFVPPGDPGALATALRELTADRELVARLRVAASVKAAEQFSPVTVVAAVRRRVTELSPTGPSHVAAVAAAGGEGTDAAPA